MSEFLRTREFDDWLRALRDPVGKARILPGAPAVGIAGQLRRLRAGGRRGVRDEDSRRPGLPGVLHPARSDGVSAAVRRRQSSQKKDIRKAKELLQEFED